MTGIPGDHDLVTAAAKGDTRAFEELVGRYQHRLYNMLYAQVGDEGAASDIAQEVLLRVYQTLHQFDGRAKFSTWLYRIAMNAAISHHRGRSARKRGGGRVLSLDAENAPDPGSDARHGESRSADAPDAALASRETRDQVRAAIETLDPEHRQVILLREVEGQSYEDIATTLEISVGTVRSRLSRARDQLREKLRHLIRE